MSLEQFQARHNNHIAAAGNSSASLDPQQQPHDANDLLIKGAGMAAAGNSSASLDPQQQPHDANDLLIKGASLAGAGRELGLSEEETLAAVSRQFRKQGTKDAIRGRRRAEAQAQSTWAQKQASLGEWGDGEIDGVGYEDISETERAFGQDQSDYQNFRADDTGFTADEETGLIRRETFGESRGESVDMAPKSALRDALTQLQTGTSQYGYDAFPGSADVAGRLEADITPDRGSDAALGSELVRRDNQRFDSETAEANDWRARAKADIIAREGYTVNGPGAMADESIGRIKEIRSLGKVGETAHVVSTANDAIQGQATQRADGVYLNPQTGDPIARQGPELPGVAIGDNMPNNGSSSNSLNAPQTAREWVTQAVPDYRESSSSFGAYPQVDITLQTTNFANKVHCNQESC